MPDTTARSILLSSSTMLSLALIRLRRLYRIFREFTPPNDFSALKVMFTAIVIVWFEFSASCDVALGACF